MANGRASYSGARSRVWILTSGCRVVPLNKTYFPKSTANTQEAVALSLHDWKIVNWDVKQKRNETKSLKHGFITTLSNSMDPKIEYNEVDY